MISVANYRKETFPNCIWRHQVEWAWWITVDILIGYLAALIWLLTDLAPGHRSGTWPRSGQSQHPITLNKMTKDWGIPTRQNQQEKESFLELVNRHGRGAVGKKYLFMDLTKLRAWACGTVCGRWENVLSRSPHSGKERKEREMESNVWVPGSSHTKKLKCPPDFPIVAWAQNSLKVFWPFVLVSGAMK